jgi:hypothetical protein
MTPGYDVKHFWRYTRQAGESLKAFARRHSGTARYGKVPTTTTAWLERKRKGKR